MTLYGIISSFSLFFPIGLGLFYNRRNGRLQNYFLWFLIFSMGIEIISMILALKGQNNFWVLKVFLICDFLFITWFFYKCFYYPTWLKYLSMLMLLFMGFFLIFANKLAWPEGLFYLSIFLFSIVLSVQAFVSLLDNSEPLEHPVFWIALSRFIYFIFIFIIFVYPSIVPECYKNHLFSFIQPLIISSANILGNILLGGTFLCKKIQI